LIRYFILVATTNAGSGHPTSALSAVELMAGPFFGGTFCFDPDNPDHPNNDRIIFSKGHATPLLYALWAAAGRLQEKDLLTYRDFDSPLEGHPTPAFRYVDAAAGSLGQGLSIGGSKVLRSSNRDAATVIGAGITVHEALKAYEELKKADIAVRIVDIYSVKPLDTAALNQAAAETGRLITVEDHYAEGGIADAVRSALAVNPVPIYSLAVRKKPKSGDPQQLLDFEEIGKAGIIGKVRQII
jgi:transketolase